MCVYTKFLRINRTDSNAPFSLTLMFFHTKKWSFAEKLNWHNEFFLYTANTAVIVRSVSSFEDLIFHRSEKYEGSWLSSIGNHKYLTGQKSCSR